MELTYMDGQSILLNEFVYHILDNSGKKLKLTIEKGIRAATFQLLPYTHQCENKIEFGGCVEAVFGNSWPFYCYPYHVFRYYNDCLSFKSIDYSAEERKNFNSLTCFNIILWGKCQCPFSLQIDLIYEEKVINQCFTFVIHNIT
jgi:hypothetical protein